MKPPKCKEIPSQRRKRCKKEKRENPGRFRGTKKKGKRDLQNKIKSGSKQKRT